MDAYGKLETSIFSVFGSASWVAENISTFPSNYEVSGLEEFIRVIIIPAGPDEQYNIISGVLNIDIFVPHGNGPGRASAIADILDKHLMRKSILGVDNSLTQLYHSGFSPRGRDKDNPTLARFLYSIAFKFFGE